MHEPFVVSSRQLRAFAEDLRRRFVARERERLRSDGVQPVDVAGDVDAWIESALQQAATFDIRGGRDVSRFIDYLATYGLGFGTDERSAWAKRILQTPGACAAWKLNRLDECEPFAGGGQADATGKDCAGSATD